MPSHSARAGGCQPAGTPPWQGLGVSWAAAGCTGAPWEAQPRLLPAASACCGEGWITGSRAALPDGSPPHPHCPSGCRQPHRPAWLCEVGRGPLGSLPGVGIALGPCTRVWSPCPAEPPPLPSSWARHAGCLSFPTCERAGGCCSRLWKALWELPQKPTA